MRVKRSFRKRYVIVGLLVTLVIAAVLILLWVFSSNTGQVVDASNRKDAQLPPYLTYDGTYISFNYKSIYQAHDEQPQDGSLELVSLLANTDYQKQLAVSVAPAPLRGIESIPAYRTREDQSTVYSHSLVTMSIGKGVAWLKNDGTEDTILLQHGDKVLTLSFSTVGRADDLQTEANMLLRTLQWKDKQ